MTRKRAAIYARISQNRGGDDTKVKRQVDKCIALAEVRDHEIVKVFIDDDISAFGGRKTRPQYEQLLSAIRSDELDVVLTWHTDRLLRTVKEMVSFIELCAEHDVALEAVLAGAVDFSSPMGRAFAVMMAAVSQAEVEVKSERHKNHNAQARAAGKSTGGPTPFGWDGLHLHPVEGPLLRSGVLVSGTRRQEPLVYRPRLEHVGSLYDLRPPLESQLGQEGTHPRKERRSCGAQG